MFKLRPRTLNSFHPQIKKQPTIELKATRPATRTRIPKWGVPEMVVPLDHQLYRTFQYESSILGYPHDYGNPQMIQNAVFPPLPWRSDPSAPQVAQGRAATLRASLWPSPGSDKPRDAGASPPWCLFQGPPQKMGKYVIWRFPEIGYPQIIHSSGISCDKPYGFQNCENFERKLPLSRRPLLIQPCQVALSHNLKWMIP